MRRSILTLCAALAAAVLSHAAHAQNFVTTGGVVGGVAISTEGVLAVRETAPANALNPATRKAGNAADPRTVYVSLPRVLAAWKAARDAHADPPEDVRTLKGLTRIQYVFVYPAEHDIVLAGASEPLRTDNPLEPVGTASGRPAVQLEDLIAAIRAVSAPPADAPRRGGPRRDFYGCSLDPPDNHKTLWDDTLKKFGNGPRPALVAELKKVLGPQQVRIFGVAPDSRAALVMLAADYRLKRISMGLESFPAVGNAMGAQEAMARLWFEPAYEPLRVTADGTGYEFRGPRLKVLAGAQVFAAGGAGPAQVQFAAKFSAKVDDIAAKVDAVADLQNVTDCFMVAALLRQDGLPEKAGLDLAWLHDAAAYPLQKLPVPKTAETVVHIQGNAIAQGGVAMGLAAFTSVERRQEPLGLAPQRPAADWFALPKTR
jgi:hypothetical protein